MLYILAINREVASASTLHKLAITPFAPSLCAIVPKLSTSRPSEFAPTNAVLQADSVNRSTPLNNRGVDSISAVQRAGFAKTVARDALQG